MLASTLSGTSVGGPEIFVYQSDVGIRMVEPDGTEVCQLKHKDRKSFCGGCGKWSPDGKYFAYTSSEEDSSYPSVRLVQSDGLNDRFIAEGDFIEWSPHSDFLVYSTHRSELVKEGGYRGRESVALNLFDVRQSKSVKIADQMANSWSWWEKWPLVSPDGDYLIYPLYRDSSKLRRWELYSVKDGKKSIIVESVSPRDSPAVLCWLSDSSGFLVKRGLELERSESGGELSEILLVQRLQAGRPEEPILATGWLDRIEFVSLNPQHKKAAYIAGKKGLRILDLETLSNTKVADGDFKFLQNFVAWSPDGKELAFATDHVSIACVNGSGLRTIVTPENCGRIDQIEWSPDGRFIAYRVMIVSLKHSKNGWVEKEQRGEVRLFSLSEGREHVLVDDGSFGGWSKTGKYLCYQKRSGYEKRRASVSGVYVADGSGNKSLLIGEGRLVGDPWSLK
jgi:Tol biopolymer transport system component